MAKVICGDRSCRSRSFSTSIFPLLLLLASAVDTIASDEVESLPHVASLLVIKGSGGGDGGGGGNGSGGGSEFDVLTFVLVLALFSIPFSLLCSNCRIVKRKEPGVPAYQEKLLEVQTNMIQTLISNYSKADDEPPVPPGKYKGSYFENGTCQTNTTLIFVPHRGVLIGEDTDTKDELEGGEIAQKLANQSGGWTMKGGGKDSDGGFCITQGRIAPNGEAFWIEKCGGRRALQYGKFDPENCSFEGSWIATNGKTARYDSFNCVELSEP